MTQSRNCRGISKSRKAGYVIAAILAPVFIVFAYLGEPERGFILMCILGSFATVAYVRSSCVKRPYFICTIVPLLVLELGVAMTLNMPHKHFPGILMMPIAIVNVIALLGTLRFVEARFAPHSE